MLCVVRVCGIYLSVLLAIAIADTECTYIIHTYSVLAVLHIVEELYIYIYICIFSFETDEFSILIDKLLCSFLSSMAAS